MEGTYCFDRTLGCMGKECPAPCRVILDNVADGIVAVDRNGEILWINRTAARITGLSQEEVQGRPWKDLIAGEGDEPATSPVDRALLAQEDVEEETVLAGRRGRRIPALVTARLIRDEDGKTLGVVATLRDRSRRGTDPAEGEDAHALGGIVTRSPRMLGILRTLKDLALSDSPILLSGGSGTGKELLARAIHELSRRKAGPYIAVNCGALPETLIESELFGYRKGAFTDARQHKAGRFALAEAGTLFLDEIGDLPLDVQVKLLRVLENGEYQPLGSTETLKADVRIVTATNKDLLEEMWAGRFREDLFYRINVVQIDVPSLRQRREDIPLLIEHFLDKLNRKRNKSIVGLEPEAERILLGYAYPGNIRELENILEYASIVCKQARIEPRHLPNHLVEKRQPSPPAARSQSGPTDLKQLEKEEIIRALRAHRWNRKAAAAELGISRTTLWRKIRQLEIAT